MCCNRPLASCCSPSSRRNWVATRRRLADAGQHPRLTNGIEVAATGTDSAQILASFTDAGAARILQNGPQAENTDWTPVTVAGVSLLVPPNWKVKDLAHQDFSQGFSPNPAADHGAWFYSVVPRVFIGKADPNIVTGGLAVDQWPIAAVDAAWVYEIPADTANIGPVIASGTTNCLQISVVAQTPARQQLDRPGPRPDRSLSRSHRASQHRRRPRRQHRPHDPALHPRLITS